MQYYWRVFLWKNGGKSTEYTKWLVAPVYIEDKLDETLATGEIMLEYMPTSTRGIFPPKTKWRVERYTSSNYSDTPKTWDMVVDHDDEEEYAGLPDYVTHRIFLYEPAVVAQGMHPDNIALTYELQDVDLNYRVVYTDDTVIGNNFDLTNGNNQTAGYDRTLSKESATATYLTLRQGTFKNAYKYEWSKSSLQGSGGIENLQLSRHALNSHTITFDIPKLYVYGTTSGGAWDTTPLFQINTVTKIYKQKLLNGNKVSEELVQTVYSGAASFTTRDDDYGYSNGSAAYLRKLKAYDRYSSSGPSASASSDSVLANSWSRLYETLSQVAKADSGYPDAVTFTTDVLSQSELEEGYTLDYIIKCEADDSYQNGMIYKYEHSYYYYHYYYDMWSNNYIGHSTITALEYESAGNIAVSATIQCVDTSNGANIPYLKKGVAYNCYDLHRRALLSCDTYFVENGSTSLDEYGSGGATLTSINYPIIVNSTWAARMKTATMYETIFEQKNLWEVYLQIGYYLHAIPRFGFATDGTDRFELSFTQLGGTTTKTDNSSKLTIFNSRSLSEYYTQYDSYVTNLFSPKNVVEEYITPKTSDSSYLVSNNTAELHTKYPISEIVEFGIIYEGTEADALSFIFEKSIYEVLSSADPEQIFPAKGNSLYYTLGDNKILGLNYVAESVNSDKLMALKYIMQRLFGVTASIWTQKYTFNNLRFRIKYRTQDSLRLTQFRPDLEDFMKNSSYENYPHHEQFYGQQDKIIDSERFSANLWGKLIRVGNAIYQRQEYAMPGYEKESGDLVTINNEPYYITECENEYYPDMILQKVTYSKNFNQISQVVTIPSEPRFYEVSERSKITREVRLQEFFTISTTDCEEYRTPVFIAANLWQDFVISLIFKKERTLPNYAWTRFMADKLRYHKGENSSYISTDQLFPSSEIERTGENSVSAKNSSDHADCIVPLLHFPLHDGIVFEWDMDDNFKAGDFVDADSAKESDTADDAYMAMQSFRYVDILGRADLFRFFLFHCDSWTSEQIQKLPTAVINPPSDSPIGIQGSENKAVALDKDNREALAFNYQINLLHRKDDYSDFYTFPNLFGDKDEDLKVALLSESQSLFDESIDMTKAKVLSYNVPYIFATSGKGSIGIVFDTANIEWVESSYKLSQVKAIAFYQNNSDSGRTAFIVKNVKGLSDSGELPPWYIYPTFIH